MTTADVYACSPGAAAEPCMQSNVILLFSPHSLHYTKVNNSHDHSHT